MHRRVRHVNPAQCGAQVALDARFISGVADGAALSSWPSRSVASITASQSTPAQQPTFRAVSINGRPAVEFDGTADNMDLSAGALGLTNNAPSVDAIVVVRAAGSSGDAFQGAFVMQGGTAAPRAYINVRISSSPASNSNFRRLDADTTQSTAQLGSAATECILQCEADVAGSGVRLLRNGVATVYLAPSSGAGNFSSTNSAVVRLGAYSSAGSRMIGVIGAVIVATPKFSSAIAARIRQHLGFSFRIATA